MPFTDKYTLEERQEVVNLYVAYGKNSKQASKKSGIPAPTIRSWTQTKWWAEMVEETLQRHKKKMDGKLTHLMDLASDALIDRIKNGDEKVNAKGEPSRVKMSGKDLMYILGMSVDKRDLGRLQGFQEKKKTLESVIEAQQLALEKFTKDKKALESDNVIPLNAETQKKEGSQTN